MSLSPPTSETRHHVHCRGRIASFKIARHVFVDDFPMTSSGKIQTVRLRDEALRRLESGAARD
jgi:fatty-acyl-CoA synthase